MNALVTGGRGFIGTHLVKALTTVGTVKVADKQNGPHDDLRAWAYGAARVDLGIDTVFHLASRVGADQDRIVGYCDDNVVGTAALLEAMTDRNVQHMVLASSCVAMWGGTPYAATKAAQEELCAVWCEANGVTLSILRLHAVYGPGQGENGTYEGVVAKVAHALVRGEAPVVDDDGLQIRDFVHVDDVVSAMRLAAVARFNGTAEIGTGRGTHLIDVVSALREHLGGPLPTITGVRRQGDVREMKADLSGTERFGWSPTMALSVGLAAYAKSLKVRAVA